MSTLRLRKPSWAQAEPRDCGPSLDAKGQRLTGHVCRADDLIPEENETVQVALKRLSEKESYDRIFRIRRAFQVCLGCHEQREDCLGA